MVEEADIIDLKHKANAPDMFCRETEQSSSASSINSVKNKPLVRP